MCNKKAFKAKPRRNKTNGQSTHISVHSLFTFLKKERTRSQRYGQEHFSRDGGGWNEGVQHVAGLIFPTAPRSVGPGYYLASYPGTGTFVLLPSSLALTNLCLFSDFLVQNAILYLFSFHFLVCSKLRDCSGKYEPPLTSVIVQLFKFRTVQILVFEYSHTPIKTSLIFLWQLCCKATIQKASNERPCVHNRDKSATCIIGSQGRDADSDYWKFVWLSPIHLCNAKTNCCNSQGGLFIQSFDIHI